MLASRIRRGGGRQRSISAIIKHGIVNKRAASHDIKNANNAQTKDAWHQKHALYVKHQAHALRAHAAYARTALSFHRHSIATVAVVAIGGSIVVSWRDNDDGSDTQLTRIVVRRRVDQRIIIVGL